MMVDKCGTCDFCLADMIENPTNGAVATASEFPSERIHPKDWQRIQVAMIEVRMALQREVPHERA